MSDRRDDVFHVLKVVRRIVDQHDEGIEPAIASVDTDRALVDKLRADLLSEGAMSPTMTSSITKLHTLCHFLIGERETLGKALDEIRRELELVDVAPRTRNLGPSARGTDRPKKAKKPS